jgi:hypothetical protein
MDDVRSRLCLAYLDRTLHHHVPDTMKEADSCDACEGGLQSAAVDPHSSHPSQFLILADDRDG